MESLGPSKGRLGVIEANLEKSRVQGLGFRVVSLFRAGGTK